MMYVRQPIDSFLLTRDQPANMHMIEIGCRSNVLSEFQLKTLNTNIISNDQDPYSQKTRTK